MAVGCAEREACDDVHVMSAKLAVNRRRVTAIDGQEVDALLMTTVHPSTPKIMLNVDIGDYATSAQAPCGCPMESFGPRIHTIRSHEKLTAGGMHFIGSDILSVLEEQLPTQHGGAPGDYQFVEEEEDGKSRISIAVHPAIELRDPEQLPETILGALSSSSRGGHMMAEQWRQTQALRVVRTAPLITDSGKTPPIRVMPR